MRKLIIMLLLSATFLLNHSTGFAQQPDYEKFGRIAIAVVKEDYPGQAVVEYEYEGRKQITPTDVQDAFRFKVMENQKPKVVVVNIKHSTKNKKLLGLTVEER